MLGPYDANVTAPFRNREPASVGFSNMIDGPLRDSTSSVLNVSRLRLTAVPAGSRGQIVASTADPTKLVERNAPGTPIRLLVATWAPDATQVPLPSTKTEITDGVEFLANSGFNAIRIHGLEYWLMSNTGGVLEFPADRLDNFYWFLAECKRVGLYWILNPRQNELYLAGSARFSMPAGTPDQKPRIFVQQDARDLWTTGFERLYNKVNPYTGINILKDPALFLVECFNECSAQQTSQVTWPAMWTTRESTRGTGALTFNEWLDDPTMEHGYNGSTTTARRDQINASWGTAFSSIAAIPAPSGTDLPNLSMASTQKSIDIVLYLDYLDTQLASFFVTQLTRMGCTALVSSNIGFPNVYLQRNSAKTAGNDVVNLHNYTFLSQVPSPGANLGSGVANDPAWGWESWLYSGPLYSPNKPAYLGEYGWPYWGRYRTQYPMLAAYAAFGGAAGVSLFYQGDFFSSTYSSSAKSRVSALFPLAGHSDPAMRFAELAMFFAFALGYVAESSYLKTLILNSRFMGLSPRNAGRVSKSFFNLFLPVSLYNGVVKTRLSYTDDTSDDSLTTTELNKSWATICSELQAAGAITVGNAAYVDSQANTGTITAVATSGVVGSVTASPTQPVLTLAPSNTLVDGDQIAITNLTGTVGVWPGTDRRGSRATVLLTGVANRVQITSGLDLTGLSGFTAGTWSGFANEMQSNTGELYVSRRRKFVAADAPKYKFVSAITGATIPAFTGFTVNSLSDKAGLFIAPVDDTAISTSQRLVFGFCGNVRNTGDTYSSNDTVIDTVGAYPIQYSDDTVVFSLAVTDPHAFKLYRLDWSGERISRESFTVDSQTGRAVITLRTGSVQPTIFWEFTKGE